MNDDELPCTFQSINQFFTDLFSSFSLLLQISDRLAALSNLIKANEEQHVDPTDCSTFDSCNVA